jgi:hypothetical protein
MCLTHRDNAVKRQDPSIEVNLLSQDGFWHLRTN